MKKRSTKVLLTLLIVIILFEFALRFLYGYSGALAILSSIIFIFSGQESALLSALRFILLLVLVGLPPMLALTWGWKKGLVYGALISAAVNILEGILICNSYGGSLCFFENFILFLIPAFYLLVGTVGAIFIGNSKKK